MSCSGSNLYNIQPLSLSDTFHTWFDRTNEVIDVVNGVNLLSVEVGPTSGLEVNEGCCNGYFNGVVTFDAKVAAGVGIGPLYPGSYYPNHILLDYSSVGQAGSTANPANNDWFVFSDSSDNTLSTGAGTPKRVNASYMLPPKIIMGNGANSGGELEIDGNLVVRGDLIIDGDQTFIDSNDVRIEDRIIELAYARYVEFDVSGPQTSISSIVSGMTAYYKDPGLGFTTNNPSTIGVVRGISANSQTTATLQLHKFDFGGVSDIVVGGGLFIGTIAAGTTCSVTNSPTTITDFYPNSTLSPAGVRIKGLEGDKDFLWTKDYNRWATNTNLGVTGKNLWIVGSNFASFGYDDGTQRDNTFTFMGASGQEVRWTLGSGSLTSAGSENSSWYFIKRNNISHGRPHQVLSLVHYAGGLFSGGVPQNEFHIANFHAGRTGPVHDTIGVSGWAQNLNVDQLDGAHAYRTPAPYSIPVAGPDGKIDPEWLAASSVRKKFIYPNHGFVVGDIVRIKEVDGSLTFAQANSVPTAEALGMVSLIDGSEVTVTTYGFVLGITDGGAGRLAALGRPVTGSVYFLSPDVPGGMILEPDRGATILTTGEVRKAMFLSTGYSGGLHSGFIFDHPGTLVLGENRTDSVFFPQLAPVGGIAPWAGPIDRIPLGWLLCDGRVYDRNIYWELFDVIGNAYSVESKSNGSANAVVMSGSTRDIRANDMLRLVWGLGDVSSADVTVSDINTNTRLVTFTTNPLTGIPAGTNIKVYGRINGQGRPTFFIPDLRGKTIFGVSEYSVTPPETLSLSGPAIARGELGGNYEVELVSDNIPNHAHGTFGQPVATDSFGTARGLDSSLGTRTAAGISGVNDSGSAFSIMPPYVGTHWIIRYQRNVDAIILTGHNHDFRYIRYDAPHFIGPTGQQQFHINAAVLSDGVLGPDIFNNQLTIKCVTGASSNDWDWWTNRIPVFGPGVAEHQQSVWTRSGFRLMGGDSEQASINIFNNNVSNYNNPSGSVDNSSINFWGVGISGVTFPARYCAGIVAGVQQIGANGVGHDSITGLNRRYINFNVGGMTGGRTVFQIMKDENPAIDAGADDQYWFRRTRFFLNTGLTSSDVHTSNMKHVMIRNNTELVEYTGTSISGSDLYMSGGLTVAGNARFLKDVAVDGVLNVVSNAITGASINTNTDIGGNLGVSGDAVFGGSGHFKGNVKIDGNLNVNFGNIRGELNLFVEGSITADDDINANQKMKARYLELTGLTSAEAPLNISAIRARGNVAIFDGGLSASGSITAGNKFFMVNPRQGTPATPNPAAKVVTWDAASKEIACDSMYVISTSNPPVGQGASQYPNGFIWYKISPSG